MLNNNNKNISCKRNLKGKLNTLRELKNNNGGLEALKIQKDRWGLRFIIILFGLVGRPLIFVYFLQKSNCSLVIQIFMITGNYKSGFGWMIAQMCYGWIGYFFDFYF